MRCAFCILFFLTALNTATAGIVELDTSENQFDAGVNNQGWWSDTTLNTDGEDSVLTGTLFGDNFRSFYTFDLSSVAASDTVNSATLTIRLGNVSTPGTATIGFFAVATDAATLNDNGVADLATRTAIYTDLGSGTSYGSSTFATPADSALPITFDLNSDAILAIQSGLGGGYFSIGGSLLTSGAVFGGVGEPGDAVKLTLNTTAVPEPSSVLVLCGFGCVAGLRRRRR